MEKANFASFLRHQPVLPQGNRQRERFAVQEAADIVHNGLRELPGRGGCRDVRQKQRIFPALQQRFRLVARAFLLVHIEHGIDAPRL